MQNTGSILLVEDNQDDAELTQLALRRANVVNRIEHVADGQEALDYIFREGKYASRPDQNPAVILLDLKLPKVGGVDILKKIKAEKRFQRIPIVVLTSSDEEGDIVSSYDYGANSYIRKPVEFERFRQAVTQVGLYWVLLNEQPPIVEK